MDRKGKDVGKGEDDGDTYGQGSVWKRVCVDMIV